MKATKSKLNAFAAKQAQTILTESKQGKVKGGAPVITPVPIFE